MEDIKDLASTKHSEKLTLKILESILHVDKVVDNSFVPSLLHLARNTTSKKVACKVIDFLLEGGYLSYQDLRKFVQAHSISGGEAKMRVQETLIHHPFVSKADLKYVAKYGVRLLEATQAFSFMLRHMDMKVGDLREIFKTKGNKHQVVTILAEDALFVHPSRTPEDFQLITRRRWQRQVKYNSRHHKK